MMPSFVDIHCHILPGIDDGPPDWKESLAMARLAVEDGTHTIIATPHQLGAFDENVGRDILPLVNELQQRINAEKIPLRVLSGGELRIEPDLVAAYARGEALSLGNHARHLLIELPHDLYFPIDSLLNELSRRKITAVLAHPERNGGLLRQPTLVSKLVEAGCLMQVTASSLCGAFGKHCQRLAEELIADQLVHFIASDGHGTRSRRPLLRSAFDRVVEIASEQTAVTLCCDNPHRVATNQPVSDAHPRPAQHKRGWFQRRAAG